MGQYDNITNLGMNWGDGNENASGVAEIGYFIPYSWLVPGTGLKKPAGGTTAESLITITGNHVLIAGKYPIAVTPLFDKSGINWESVGEVMSQIMQQGADVFIPDNSVKSLGSIQALKNYAGILLIAKNDDSNHWWQIGSAKIKAKLKLAGGTGVGPTGEVGTKVTAMCHAAAPVYIYQGEVPAPAP
jgi:hypothetical protein